MPSPQNKRRITRSRQSVSYQESPEEPKQGVRKSARKSLLKNQYKDENTDEDSPLKRISSARRSLLPSNNAEAKKSADDSPVFKKSSKTINKRRMVDKSSESEDEKPTVTSKTPKKGSKSARKADEEPTELSPKKLRRNRAMSEKGLEAIVSESSPTIAKIDTPAARRSTRKTEQRYSDINLKINLNKKTVERVKGKKKILDSSDEEEVKDVEETTIEKVEKPTTLFVEDEDVEGGALYSFQTPKKKDSMALLAQQHTPKTPRHNGTPKTPKTRLSEVLKTPTSRPSALQLAKTPKHVRVETKKSELVRPSRCS